MRRALFFLAVAVVMVAQSPERFEVASVRITPPAEVGFTKPPQWGSATFTASNISFSLLVQYAYGHSDADLVGIDKCGSERYDVSAKPEGGGALTFERAKAPLQALLADRFGLRVHTDSKVVSGYNLVRGKTPLKLQATDETPTTSGTSILNGILFGRSVEMAGFAFMLSRPLGQPVEDKTGITGTYSINLQFAPENAAPGSPQANRPSLFAAVQELGLRLEPTKLNVEKLVIDACNKVPTEN